jgi:hypothetical protein
MQSCLGCRLSSGTTLNCTCWDDHGDYNQIFYDLSKFIAFIPGTSFGGLRLVANCR